MVKILIKTLIKTAFMADIPAGNPYIIRGITTKGGSFRPSDWAERLAGAFSVVAPDNRMNYSPHVQPMTLDGIRCVVVNRQLKAEDPHAYRFLQTFAKSNDLVTENDG
ncbi:MAG: DUF3579 domain-containing protein [Thiobacillaceae bacterium]